MTVKRLSGNVVKGWGHEEIFVTNDKYCGKFLHFKKGARCSMHFHAQKHETWRVMSGRFLVLYIDTTNASQRDKYLEVGDVWVNTPLLPHQIMCVEEGTILEISTPDSVDDNYRVFMGDSQVAKYE